MISLGDYHIYYDFFSVKGLIQFLYFNRSNISGKRFNDLLFDESEKKIFTFKSEINGQKSVTEKNSKILLKNKDFKEEIKKHNEIIKEIFKSNGNVDAENIILNENKENNSEKNFVQSKVEDLNDPIQTETNPNYEDSKIKSDF